MHLLKESGNAIREALAVLKSGGIVGHATETCYGFACDLTNPAAVEKLFAIKQRPADQPVSALFASVEEAKKFVEWNDRAEELAKKHLPGPLTLILPLRADAPMKLYVIPRSPNPESRILTVGIRVSSYPLAMKLATKFGKPVSTTSANLHGKPNPYSAEEIAGQFEGEPRQPDFILDSGELPATKPSTILDLSGRGERLVRQG